jgi:hypothetical protein
MISHKPLTSVDDDKLLHAVAKYGTTHEPELREASAIDAMLYIEIDIWRCKTRMRARYGAYLK